MHSLSAHDTLRLCLALALMLGLGRIFAILSQRLQQPAVLGEIVAGVVLGPTLLGVVWPEAFGFFFPRQGPLGLALSVFTSLSIILFLCVAGMEVDLNTVWKQGKRALIVGTGGMVFPFVLGWGSVWLFPSLFAAGTPNLQLFSIFFATALSISALPVIAKTLMDLALLRSDLGVVIMAAAIMNDLMGWIIFALLMGQMQSDGHHTATPGLTTIVMILLFAGLMLTAGRWVFNKSLLWLSAHTEGPGPILSLAICGALLGAAATEALGIHPIFGSFLVGVALGNSAHLLERNRQTLEHFISCILAPLFFVSIGLKVNFVAHFDWKLTLVVVVIACLGKIVGCSLAAWWSGMQLRESLAVGFGLNARGAMEIILGLLALESGLIKENMFVALVIMALLTSMLSGGMIRWILQQQRKLTLADYLDSRAIVYRLESENHESAIAQLCQRLAQISGLPVAPLQSAVLDEESVLSTGLGYDIAVPHAGVKGLPAPLLAVGLSPTGLNFNAPDGQKAHLILLLLTPEEDKVLQLQLFTEIGQVFNKEEDRQAFLKMDNFTELKAWVRGRLHSNGH
ncbi:MAG: cation:proton antiporter [Candidatus Sericytochromatia bacterium]|nr:cation:proton antiporter [Candidatus Sericytochromatia bacterium]